MGFWVTVLLAISGSVLLYFIKQYFNGGACTIRKNIQSKIVVITGASSGIGLEVARYLAAMQATVIFACRNQEKTLRVIQEIKEETLNSNLEFMQLDLSNLRSVNEFCLCFKKRFSQIDILINNAGIMRNTFEETEDGNEMTYATNHLGHFALTYQLFDLIRRNQRCRIINVSSAAHSKIEEIDVSRLNDEDYFHPETTYQRSKLCNILFTKELQKKLKGTGVKVISVHPGMVRSDLIDGLKEGKIFYQILYYVFYPVYWLFTKDTWQGAQTTVYCALEKHDKLKEGAHYSDCEIDSTSDLSSNPEIAQQLWDESAVSLGYI